MIYRQYDTEIFYDKRSGDILSIAPEIAGVIVEQERPTVESISAKEGIPQQDIGIKTIQYGKLLDTLLDRQILNINIERDSLVMTEDGGYYVIHYDGQDEKHEHSLDDVLAYYNEHYIHNLRNILEVEDIYFEWVSIDDMEIREQALEFSWFNYFDDGFVAESFSDRTKIARDIIENGTYWPLVVMKGEKTFTIYEGSHRIISAKLMQASGEWDGRKFLCMVSKEEVPSMQGGPVGFKKLPRKMRARAPYICKFYDFGYINDSNRSAIMDIMKDRNIVFIDDKKEIIEYDIYTYSELLQSTQSFPHWLRDLFYHFKEDGVVIKGNEIINSEKAFEDWKDCHAERP